VPAMPTSLPGGKIHVIVCNGMNGDFLCEMRMRRDTLACDIRAAVARATQTPAPSQILFLGAMQICNDATQPLAFGLPSDETIESVTLSVLKSVQEPSERDALKELKPISGRPSLASIVFYSRSYPVYAWRAFASQAALSLSFGDSSCVSALLLRNGSEKGARQAISLFMDIDARREAFFMHRGRLLSNRRCGGRGTYQHWLHSFDCELFESCDSYHTNFE